MEGVSAAVGSSVTLRAELRPFFSGSGKGPSYVSIWSLGACSGAASETGKPSLRSCRFNSASHAGASPASVARGAGTVRETATGKAARELRLERSETTSERSRSNVFRHVPGWRGSSTRVCPSAAHSRATGPPSSGKGSWRRNRGPPRRSIRSSAEARATPRVRSEMVAGERPMATVAAKTSVRSTQAGCGS